MVKYPVKDKGAKTGSNVRGDPLLARRRRELARQAEMHRELAAQQLRGFRKLFSNRDLRVALKVADEVKSDWTRASIALAGDSLQIAEAKAAARRKLDRLLGRALPNAAKARSLRKAHVREHGKLSAAALADLLHVDAHLGWGDLTAPLTNAVEFVPPFTSFDVQTIDAGDFVVRDDSFAKPEIGHLVNNFDYDQNESTSILDGLTGSLAHAGCSNWAACGVAFTTPSEGRLQVSAVLRNFYNKVMFSVSDKFGFSSAKVNIHVKLFIVVVRGTKAVFMPTLIRSMGLVSHGSDLSFAESEIDDTVPFTITATTDQRFNANEAVLVLAGSNVVVESILDDMHSKVDAVLWWQLQKLSIGMAEDIFT